MKTIHKIACTALVLSLAGCVTPYAASGWTGGYKEQQIDTNTYQVSFVGNGNTTGDMVWNYWIYRCAELTRAHGFDYMDTVGNIGKVGSNDAAPTFVPAVMQGQGGYQMVKTHHGGGGGGGHYVYTPGYSYSVTTYSKNAFVRMYHASDMAAPRPVLRAQTVLDLLKPYVDSSGKVAAPARIEIIRQAIVTQPSRVPFGNSPGT